MTRLFPVHIAFLLVTLLLHTVPAYSATQRFHPERAVYGLAYRNEARSDLNPLFQSGTTGTPATASGLARTVSVTINGTAELQHFSEQLTMFRMAQAKIRLVIDGTPAKQYEKAIAKALSHGIVFARDSSGAITTLWLPPEHTPVPHGIIKTLLSHMQIVTQPVVETLPTSWEVEEQDPTGWYRTRYTVADRDRDRTSIRKKKLNYLTRSADSGIKADRLATSYTPQGELLVTIEQGSTAPVTISGTVRHELLVGNTPAGHSETTLTLKRRSRSGISTTARNGLERRHSTSLTTRPATTLAILPTRDEADAILYRQKLGNETPISIRRTIATAEKAGKQPAEVTDLYLTLKALFYMHPEQCGLFAQKLAGSHANSLTFRITVSALAAINTPAAQAAIGTIVTARAAEIDTVVQLLPVMGMFEQPTVDTEQTLRNLAYGTAHRDVAETAQLALSVIARTIATTDPDRSRSIIDEYMKHFGTDTDPDTTRKTMLVLGNSAPESHLPWLLHYTGAAAADLRSGAMFALRFYPFDKTGDILLKAARTDRDATTRRDAIKALGFMPPHKRIVATLTDCYHTEKIADIRLEALKSLWKGHRIYPEIEKLIQLSAEQDESEELRNAAKALITQS